MSAKHSKKGAKPPAPSAPVDLPLPVAAAGDIAAAAAAEAAPSWLDSSDPRKRLWGKIVFVGLWIYVGALWLLALDQTFDWGIFGPKIPPLP